MKKDDQRRLGKLLASAVGFLALLLCEHGLAANRWSDYDRLRAVEKFLDAVYPHLGQEKGLLTVQTDEFNSYPGRLYVFFIECRPGSGVPGGGGTLPYPNCSGVVGSVHSEFLQATIETGPEKFPIHRFYAQGKFVEDKQSDLLAEIKAHPDWKEPDLLAALRKAGAKFGPENKEAFLRSVPIDVIYEFSACRLDLRNATFGADYGWVVQGTYRQGRKQYPCHATFEPFDGKLIGIDEV
jgi:hypothetical protein